MTNTTPPKPRKLPKQSRSLLLVKAIQEACLQILEKEGPDKLTTQRIADVAGINIASLYQYFPNKEAVLASTYKEEMSRSAQEVAKRFKDIQSLSEQSLEQTLATIIDIETGLLAHLYHIDPNFYLAYRQNFDIHRLVEDLTIAQTNPSWKEWFPSFLRIHRQRLREGDIDTMSFIARRSLEGNLHAALQERPESLSDESFKSELLTLLLNYLLKDPQQ